jgi:hypothetical protein
MIMVREVLNCRPGKVRELVEKFKALGAAMEEMGVEPFRLFTDVAAEQFWTLVLQSEHETLDDFNAVESRIMSDDRAKAALAGYHDLVVSGRREIYKVEG